jgi:hypothetical protein
MWYKLLIAFNKAARFKFPINAHQITVANGIYILLKRATLSDKGLIKTI